jgi:hypothetical protein
MSPIRAGPAHASWPARVTGIERVQYPDVHVGWWRAMTARHEGTTRLVERPAARESACRCGTRFSPGGHVLEVKGLPPEVRGFLGGRTFCSRHCVRVAFLEVLNAIDQLETPPARQTVEDLEVVFAKLALALGQSLSPPR